MGMNELQQRIHRFREDYLETPVGRNHYQIVVREHTEVQEIFRGLRTKQKAGEDITEEVLKRLLPYSDTENNRQRGTHISTWPCITKDVKMWFEGARWKDPGDWESAASWLLDIAEAGQLEDWGRWRSLATMPIQKGFACGFITPVVHCLNPKLPVINSKVVRTYTNVAIELGLASEISAALEEYPENQQKILELLTQLAPLGLRELMEWDIYCHWNIVKKLGGGGIQPPPPVPPAKPSLTVAAVQGPASTKVALCEELKQAQYDTNNPSRFEEAVTQAFFELGFEAEHIGGAGEADVFASADLGAQSFSLVIDAKTTQQGTVKGNINYDPVKGHQEQHEADYALVVAPGFSQGNTIQNAKNRGVGLLTTDNLILLCEEQARSGLSLCNLKELLAKVGLIELQLEAELQPRIDMLRALKAVLEIYEVYQRRDESSSGLDAQAAYWLCRGRGDNLPEVYIHFAVELLANPLIGVLQSRERGYALVLPASTSCARFGSVAQALAALQTGGSAALVDLMRFTHSALHG